MKPLLNYINNIELKRPIHLNKFYTLIDKLRLSHQREMKDIEAVRHKGVLYIVTYINDELLNELRILASDNEGTRVSAAVQNRSHSVNVNGSFLLVRRELDHPIVVMIDGDGEPISSIIQSQEALIIENRQNFIHIDQMVTFLEKHTAFKLQPNMNVIFSGGNEISNALHKKFLSKYNRIHLCMDLDLGGLRIAKNLMSLLPNIRFSLLVPDDIEKRFDNVVQRAEKNHIDDVIKLGRSTPALAPYALLIKDNEKTLEQESYLHEQ